MLRFSIQVLLLLTVCWLAWRRGGWPEKVVSAALLAQLSIDQILHFVLGTRGTYLGLHLWHFPLDLFLLAIIIATALKADRWWVIWAGSAQILAVGGHLLRAIDAGMMPKVYAILERFPFWIVILLTGVGAITRISQVAKRNT